MPVVKNDEAKEIPWRPGYRNFMLAGEAQGVSVSSSMGVLEEGAETRFTSITRSTR